MVDVVFFRSPVEISTPPKNSLGPQKFSIRKDLRTKDRLAGGSV